MKQCSKCGKSKSPSEFRVFHRSADGLAAWCIQCHLDASRAHYQANKAARNAAAKAWAAENPEKMRDILRKSAEKHKEKRADSHKEWGKKNRDVLRLRSAARKAVKLRATPTWANASAIRAIYKDALRQQVILGVQMHVDHIVPLQSKLVCGLHCEANLRVIPGSENSAKKNYWWPDMPISRAQAQGQLIPHEQPKQVQESLV